MMRSVAGWIGALWLVAGCTVPGDVARTCTSDDQCGQNGRCDTSVGLCYAAGTEPELDGGTCSPACAAYEACTTGGCRPRFTALNILSPANNAEVDGGPVQVSAQLVVNPAYAATTQYPATLIFSATRDGGVDVGSFGSVTRTGDTYTAPWMPPVAETQITLKASHPTPMAVQSAAVNVQVDTVPPVFTITIPNPPTRSAGSAGTQANEQDPAPGYGQAYRRDEAVTVQVSATEPVSNVTLTIVGIGPGGTSGNAQSPVAVQPGGTCNGSPAFCGNVIVDLSAQDMRDFRGTMELRVAGRDAVGNQGSANAPLKVTRWKWVFDAGGAIAGSPSVGARGTLYFGTTTGTGTGKMLAVGQDGARKWEAAVGDVSGNSAVGAFASSEENVYVAAKTAAVTALYALRGSDGSEKYKCTYTNATELPGSIAVGSTAVAAGTAETAVGIYTGSSVRLVSIRPDTPLMVDRCWEVSGTGGSAIPPSVAGGSLVMKRANIFYGTTTLKLTSYDVESGSNSARTGWPQTVGDNALGLALTGDQLYAAISNPTRVDLGTLSLSTVPTSGGTLSTAYPPSGSSRVFQLVIGTGNTAYFGAETPTSAELVSLALGPPVGTPAKASNVGTMRAAPVIGKNDRFYTLKTAGQLTAWTASSLVPIWNVDLGLDLSAKDTPLTLDCRRDGSGNSVAGASSGMLYFAFGTKVYAFIVDSPGMDPSAPWPKFQHDARNTGNPDTPITNCP